MMRQTLLNKPSLNRFLIHINDAIMELPVPYYGDGERIVLRNIISYDGSLYLDIYGNISSIISKSELWHCDKAFLVSSRANEAIVLERFKVHYWDLDKDVVLTHSINDKEITAGRMTADGIYEVVADGDIYLCIQGEVMRKVHKEGLKILELQKDVIIYEGGFIYDNVQHDFGRTPRRVETLGEKPLVLVDGVLYQVIYHKDSRVAEIRDINVEDENNYVYIKDMRMLDKDIVVLCDEDGQYTYIDLRNIVDKKKVIS
ncbi:MAG: hypothetical protein WBK20_01580 [Spirochaetota bacterium]